MVVSKGGRVVAGNVRVARGFFDRALGLMFSKGMGGFDGLLLEPCRSVHTCFMRYPIDVVFLDGGMRVVGLVRRMPPWRMTRLHPGAVRALELMGGALPADVGVGDRLEGGPCTS